ncbi:MAG: hypothetical protein HCA25_09140 [Dolichospermum sp. DET50]|jgi:adenylyltransferase/sulfurtransferase|nr:hypothetical protein [Dolichospermum sp. DET66]MBS3032440.1 hypothetical protein [Dolichospermum sp. DET67]MBS3037645.1 hypothetical protein [Dolichospermum sp. DET50]QSX69600.1 MAG: hypothetical protein EZY12_08360 [Dolichospermum sp. DET69]
MLKINISNLKLKIALQVLIWLIIIFGSLLSAMIYNSDILKPLMESGIPLNHLSGLPILGDKIRAASIPQITVQELQKLILSKNPQLLLIDVRTPAEYEYTHIPGAILVPLTDVEAGIGIINIKSLTPGHKLITYCSVGVRSNKALELLKSAGITGENVKGGIHEWRNKIDPSMPEL